MKRAMIPGEEGAPTRYYHVAPPDYKIGDSLWSARYLDEWFGFNMRERSIAKWGDGMNEEEWDRICLHDSLEDAKEYKEEYEPDGIILEILLDEEAIEEYGLEVGVNFEGYAYVEGQIPAELITVVILEEA